MKTIAEVEMCKLTGRWCVKIEGCLERFYLSINGSEIRMVDAINQAHVLNPDLTFMVKE